MSCVEHTNLSKASRLGSIGARGGLGGPPSLAERRDAPRAFARCASAACQEPEGCARVSSPPRVARRDAEHLAAAVALFRRASGTARERTQAPPPPRPKPPSCVASAPTPQHSPRPPANPSPSAPLRRRSRCCRRACSLARPPRPSRRTLAHVAHARAAPPSCSSPAPSASADALLLVRRDDGVARRTQPCDPPKRASLAFVAASPTSRYVASPRAPTPPRLPHRLLRAVRRDERAESAARAGARPGTVTRDGANRADAVRRTTTFVISHADWNSPPARSCLPALLPRFTPPRPRASRCRRRRGPRPSPASRSPPQCCNPT